MSEWQGISGAEAKGDAPHAVQWGAQGLLNNMSIGHRTPSSHSSGWHPYLLTWFPGGTWHPLVCISGHTLLTYWCRYMYTCHMKMGLILDNTLAQANMQELPTLSSVTLYCWVTIIFTIWISQISKILIFSLPCLFLWPTGGALRRLPKFSSTALILGQ